MEQKQNSLSRWSTQAVEADRNGHILKYLGQLLASARFPHPSVDLSSHAFMLFIHLRGYEIEC